MTVNLNGLNMVSMNKSYILITHFALRYMVLTLGEVSDFLSAETLTQEKSGITQEPAPSFKHGSNCSQAKVPPNIK